MSVRRRTTAAPLALVVAASVALGGCVPQAVGPSPSPGSARQPEPTPSPSPSGPTPLPSFVRPTPTPLPTFFVYTVVRGDNLLSIARSFRTTGRSIAYWNRATYPSLDPDSVKYEPNRIQVGWRLQLIPGGIVDEQALPGLTPAPASPTPPLASGGGEVAVVTPEPGAGAIVVSHGSRERQRVALTFDMSDRQDGTIGITSWLVANGIRATIFADGASGSQTPIGRDVVELVALRPDLLDLGNRSWDDPVFTDLGPGAVVDQLQRAETALGGVAAVTTKPWFRPPGGAWDEDVRSAVGTAGWAYLVLWDIDTNDAERTSEGGPTALDIETKVLSRVESGSIVLLHLGGWNTLEALPGIVAGLKAKGLETVTLTELLLQ